MYVNANLGAAQAAGYLQNTSQQLNNTLAQLSSGYSITSAASNPAGLAISQQMQSQIDGMQQAYQNAGAGTSFLQTTDGALSQIQNILQSMYSLATQAANSTNVGVDRGSIQSQVNQYTKEINSITNQTAFNTKNLLDGVLGTVNLAIGADPGQEIAFQLGAVDATSLGVAGKQIASAAFNSPSTAATNGVSGLSIYGGSSTTNPYGSNNLTDTNYSVNISAAQEATVNGIVIGSSGSAAVVDPSSSTAASTEGKIAAGGVTYTGTTTQQVMVQVASSTSGTITSVSYSTDGGSTYTAVTANASGNYVLGNTGATIVGADITTNSSTSAATDTYTMNLAPASTSLQLVNTSTGEAYGSAVTVLGTNNAQQTVTVGNPNNGEAVAVNFNPGAFLASGATFSTSGALSAPVTNDFTVSYNTGNAANGAGGTINQKAVASAGLSVMSYNSATTAQTAIQAALTQVASERAQVGSLMDRLNQASQDLQTSQQNLQGAQAGIIDVNVAQASAQLAQQQVLQQAGVAMLATANQTPAALLKLLP